MSTYLIAHFNNGTTDSRPTASREEARLISSFVYGLNLDLPGIFIRVGDAYESYVPAERGEHQPRMIEIVTR